MGILVTPGVYTFENDLSLYARQLSTTMAGIVGTARKGELNKLKLISSPSQFLEEFGEPTTHASRAAWSYLKEGDQLRFVRVAGASALEASAILLDVNDDPTLNVIAVSKGTWGNSINIIITAGTTSGFKLQVVDSKTTTLLESYDNITKADYATALQGSKYVVLTEADVTNTNDPKPAPYTLASGDDGEVTTPADYIGTFIGDVATGLQIFRNAEVVDINILLCAGVSDMPVILEGIDICSSRGDALYLVDPPFGMSTQEVIEWHNGTGAWAGLHQALNDSYGCLQWTWHKLYDPYTKEEEWVPPSVPTLRIMVHADNVAGVAAAPAGYERGIAKDSLAIEYSPTLGQRKDLNGNGNVINPFINDPKEGIVLLGQRTLQREPTALDRINVRRLMNSVKKIVASVIKYLEFEPHNVRTMRRYSSLVRSVLDPILAAGDIYEYRVICDETNNTPELIDQNTLVGDIFIKPTKTAEIIRINWNILSTGAEFTEYV
jgi:phage tail sheath protein FI